VPHRPLLALALVSALTGCVAAPPAGPLVEYRDGLTPITRPVKCPATYVLRADPPGAVPLAEHHVAEGERIGFRREEDGSVSAVAPGYTIALAPGAYSWVVVRGSVPSWRERFWCETRKRADAAGRTTVLVVGTVALLTTLLALGLLYAWAEGNGSNSLGYKRR
jgi:hypothetical protein